MLKHSIYVVYFALVGFFVIKPMVSNLQAGGNTTAAALSFYTAVMTLWSLMGFGVRHLLLGQFLSRLAFQVSTLSLCSIAFWFFTDCSERFVGAWLSLIAGLLIFSTYVFDHISAWRFKRANAQTG